MKAAWLPRNLVWASLLVVVAGASADAQDLDTERFDVVESPPTDQTSRCRRSTVIPALSMSGMDRLF
ncbi:MAG: hypothetical protein CM1200mP36_01080 [Gammaproteobacteria bacterium]|nr:MAG: hypothetical protein CM1200mP36_01080 [Gammaproteobacteria bacterium]